VEEQKHLMAQEESRWGDILRGQRQAAAERKKVAEEEEERAKRKRRGLA
jgi:hypothetical protein